MLARLIPLPHPGRFPGRRTVFTDSQGGGLDPGSAGRLVFFRRGTGRAVRLHGVGAAPVGTRRAAVAAVERVEERVFRSL